MAALRDSRLAVFVAHLQEGRGGRHDGDRKLVLAEAAREDRRRHVDLLSERNNNNHHHLNKYIKLNGVFSEMMERKIKTGRFCKNIIIIINNIIKHSIVFSHIIS